MGAKLELMPAGYPGFLETNLARLREYSNIEYDGTPVLLRKPLGELEHGGRKVFADGTGDPGYQVLAQLVSTFGSGDACETTVSEPTFDDVSPRFTQRRRRL